VKTLYRLFFIEEWCYKKMMRHSTLSTIRSFVFGFILFAWIGIVPAFAADYSREQILAALADVPPVAQQDPAHPPVAPQEKDPYLQSLQKMASAKPDPELIQALLQYQFAYRSPDNPLPGRVLGQVYLDQPDAVLAVYNKMPAAQRIVLIPYLIFGYDKATESKNKSLPKLVACQRKLDHLKGSLMNARSRDDSH
jgi:hypothetical protein